MCTRPGSGCSSCTSAPTADRRRLQSVQHQSSHPSGSTHISPSSSCNNRTPYPPSSSSGAHPDCPPTSTPAAAVGYCCSASNLAQMMGESKLSPCALSQRSLAFLSRKWGIETEWHAARVLHDEGGGYFKSPDTAASLRVPAILGDQVANGGGRGTRARKIQSLPFRDRGPPQLRVKVSQD